TFPALSNARQIVFLATGESKAEAVAAAFGPEAKPDPHVPSSLLPGHAREIKVLLDRGAGKLVESVAERR
ncbi:MAG: 6-phosphogluconolactonase, partial [Solirubrobacterales bacterium]|nr:6-phosphogluconolactonase [Solirubrobacterales bacterium]